MKRLLVSVALIASSACGGGSRHQRQLRRRRRDRSSAYFRNWKETGWPALASRRIEPR
jgi:hypothetical protein